MTLDSQKRERILKYLEGDAHITADEIAVLLGLDKTDVEAEIKAMEEEKLICGYHALINWEKADNDKVSAMVELTVNLHRSEGFDKVAELIYHYPEVESLYLVSGGYDFLVILKKASMREIANFVSTKLATLDEVATTATHVLLSRYKEQGVDMVGHNKKDMRMVVTP